MAIKGSLKEASLPDVVQLLFFGRRTGCLTLSDRQRFGSVFFEDGWITYATIVNRRDRIGDILLRSSVITREQLDQALGLQRMARGRRLGEILVSLGALAPDELKRVVRLQIEEAVYSLFAWTVGTFTFEAGVRPEWEGDLERINPENLLLEGARRIDEWSLTEKKIPSFDLVFALDKTALANESLSFTEAQRRILSLIDGARDTREVIDASGLSDFEAAQALFGLIEATHFLEGHGQVVDDVPARPGPVERLAEAVDRLGPPSLPPRDDAEQEGGGPFGRSEFHDPAELARRFVEHVGPEERDPEVTMLLDLGFEGDAVFVESPAELSRAEIRFRRPICIRK